MFEDDSSVFAAMRTGAHSYALKGTNGAERLLAIHTVANRETIFTVSSD